MLKQLILTITPIQKESLAIAFRCVLLAQHFSSKMALKLRSTSLSCQTYLRLNSSKALCTASYVPHNCYLRTIQQRIPSKSSLSPFSFQYHSILQNASTLKQPARLLSRNLHNDASQLDLLTYEELSNETLEALADFFELLGDEGLCPNNYDVEYASGVLTVHVGDGFGTYVINKQTPNRQIWLSSPISGPKRYDFVDNHWIYAHDGNDMRKLLSKEFSEILHREIDFLNLNYKS